MARKPKPAKQLGLKGIAPKRELVSRREYARRRGVSEGAVRKRIADNTIPVGPGGKIDPIVADRRWNASTDWSKPSNSVTGNPAAAGVRRLDEEPIALAGIGGSLATRDDEMLKAMRSTMMSRAAREAVRARREQIAMQREEGKLVDVDEVRGMIYAQFRRARDQIMAVPDRLALSLSMQDDKAVHAALLEEMRRICADLSRPILPAVPTAKEKG